MGLSTISVLLIFLTYISFVECLEQTIEISVDNKASDHTLKQASPVLSEKLETFLEKIDSIKKEDLVAGNYDLTLPNDLEEEYESLNRARKEDVKENMRWAWQNYASKCKGWDEIRPLSGAGHNFWGGLGMMVVESLDTLYIMNLQDEYKEARDWIVSSLNLDINHFTSVFETTIRLLGGLLSAFTLTHDPVFKDLSVDLAARLLRSHTDGLHFANVNLQTGATRMEDSRVYLSEVGTNFLELSYLSAISGDLSFVQAAQRIMAVLRRTPRLQGLLPLQYSSHGEASGRTYGMGNRGDSYYEYLLKGWMLTGDKALREEYCSSLEGLYALLLTRSGRDGLSVVTDYHGSRQRNMHHLACFLPGMLMLGVANDACPNQQRDRETAFKLMTTCVAMYNSTASGLSSDEYQVVLEKEEVQVQKRPSSRWEDLIPTGLTKYILRPETVESLYVMYAKTRNPVFREWGWQIWSTIKKRCKGRYGFADLRNVDNANSELDDRGETFFYSETMKYLYLLFSEEGPSYLDDYIFNTEAHLIQKQTRSL